MTSRGKKNPKRKKVDILLRLHQGERIDDEDHHHHRPREKGKKKTNRDEYRSFVKDDVCHLVLFSVCVFSLLDQNISVDILNLVGS